MPGVKADILAQVVKFMEHHRGVEPAIPEKPLRSKVRTNCKRTKQANRWLIAIAWMCIPTASVDGRCCDGGRLTLPRAAALLFPLCLFR